MVPVKNGYNKKSKNGMGGRRMRLLYYCDLFFWYLHKVTLVAILVWLVRLWWQTAQKEKEEKTEN